MYCRMLLFNHGYRIWVRQSLDLDWIPNLTSLEAYPIPVEKTWVSVRQMYQSIDFIKVTGVYTSQWGRVPP